jgi:hypothetical protein
MSVGNYSSTSCGIKMNERNESCDHKAGALRGQPRHSKGVPDKEHPWYHQFFSGHRHGIYLRTE